MYVLEIPMNEADIQYFEQNPKKATIWMSKKMENKGKELRWSQMPIEEKKQFDEAQCKELSQVMTSRALRSLSAAEEIQVDKNQVMSMRWVMTIKGDGLAKARLVVLGYRQPNLTSVQSSAPTMSRTARNLLLTLIANFGFLLTCGDVSSASHQAAQSLEREDLYVWAPAELAVMYGARPDFPVKILKICKAFYGLVHAPWSWFDHVTSTLHHGWKPLLSDRCVHILQDESGRVVGLCGLHVDDFIVTGDHGSPVFVEADRKLKAAYRRGKWQEKEFTFAGCDLVQHGDSA